MMNDDGGAWQHEFQREVIEHKHIVGYSDWGKILANEKYRSAAKRPSSVSRMPIKIVGDMDDRGTQSKNDGRGACRQKGV